jgi:hypothetical protein
MKKIRAKLNGGFESMDLGMLLAYSISDKAQKYEQEKQKEINKP